MDDAEMMGRALACAVAALEGGQPPFGAVVARDGRILVEVHNTVVRESDPTAHGEMNAIKAACHALGSLRLDDCTVYTTCEPCPMCTAALLWARVGRVVYAATIEDAAEAGLHQFPIGSRKLAEMAGSPITIEAGPLRQECSDLLRRWANR